MAEQSILIVDDDHERSQILSAHLTAAGYDVRRVATGEAGVVAASVVEPDLVILELDLPDIDGVELCRRLRVWLRTPIIVLADADAGERRVAVLDEGADDCVSTPYSAREMLARVRVALRHRHALAAVIDHAVIEIGDLRLDPGEHLTAIGHRRLELTPKEFQLLTLLARNAGRVVSHRTILDVVWSSSTAFDTLRLHISQLRKKLGHAPSTPSIGTVAGVGYTLTPRGVRSDLGG